MNKSLRKRVLIVADYFSPCVLGATAAKRIEAFSRFLPEFGWQPIVMARQCTCRMDDSVRADQIVAHFDDDSWISQVSIDAPRITIRVECEPDRLFRKWIIAAARSGNIPDEMESPFHGLYHTCHNWKHLLLRRDTSGRRWSDRLIQKGFSAALSFSSDATDWATRGRRIAEQVNRNIPLDAVISSAPPAVNHLMAAEIADRLQIPFLLDFRDVIDRGWTTSFRTAVSQRLQSRRVRTASRKATHCVFVTESERQRGMPQVACPEASVIPNGFFADQIEEAKKCVSTPASDKFTLRLLGTCYPQQALGTFIDGLKLFFEDKVVCERACFEYFGASGEMVSTAIQSAGLASSCRISESVSPEHALTLTVSADLLILLTTTNGQSGVPGAKFYEYLASGRPILATGADSEVAGELKRFDAGLEVQTAESVHDRLKAAFASWSRGEVQNGCVEPDSLRPFTRRNGVASLAQLLDNAIPGHAAETPVRTDALAHGVLS